MYLFASFPVFLFLVFILNNDIFQVINELYSLANCLGDASLFHNFVIYIFKGSPFHKPYRLLWAPLPHYLEIFMYQLEIRDSQNLAKPIGCLHAPYNSLLIVVKPHKAQQKTKKFLIFIIASKIMNPKLEANNMTVLRDLRVCRGYKTYLLTLISASLD